MMATALVTHTMTHTIAVNAEPARVQSKSSQCQRFEENLTRFNDRFTARENDRPTQRALLKTLLAVLNTEISQLERQTFSDATIQSLHQQTLDLIIAAHDTMTDYWDATEEEESAKAQVAYGTMQHIPYQLSDIINQFEHYCSQP